MNQKKIIFYYIFLIIILLIVPVIWSKNYNLDLIVFTEEWYKFVINLILLLFGYLIFDFLLKNIESRKIERMQNNLLDKLNIHQVSIRDLIKDKKYQTNEIKNEVAKYTYLINYIRDNSISHLNNETLMKYVWLYDQNISDAFDLISNINMSINNDVLENLIYTVMNYFQRTHSVNNDTFDN